MVIEIWVLLQSDQNKNESIVSDKYSFIVLGRLQSTQLPPLSCFD